MDRRGELRNGQEGGQKEVALDPKKEKIVAAAVLRTREEVPLKSMELPFE